VSGGYAEDSGPRTEECSELGVSEHMCCNAHEMFS
jgi:hypothetical protein